MAITAFKTFISGEVLLASDLNSSLTTIINEVNVHGSELDTINGSTQGRSRNLIINGDFSVWQRGTSQTSSGYGSSDRWYNEHNVSTKTTSQQAFTLGQTTVPGNPKYYQRTIAVTGSTSSSYTLSTYRMEDVTKTAGREVTISFWAKADAAKDIALEIRQIFGTGGSPSSSVDGDNTKVSLTTSWQKFTVTLTYNSVSGKTLGTNGNDYASINFWYEAGSTFDAKTGSLGNQSGTFDISNVQLEFGDTATEFEYVTPADQLARCKRYFERLTLSASANNYVACGLANTTTTAIADLHYLEKRAVPTVATTTGAMRATTSTGGDAGGAVTYDRRGTTSCMMVDSTATGLVAGNASLIQADANTTIDIDAEL